MRIAGRSEWRDDFGWSGREDADAFLEELLGEEPWAEDVPCDPPPPIGSSCTGLTTSVVLDCFELDRAIVLPRHQPHIVNLARCILASQGGTAAIRSLQLVGHTDPSGGTAHNRTLGQARADAIAAAIQTALAALAGASAPAVTMTTSSRAALDAIPGAAARSRRVVVALPTGVPATTAPPSCACDLGTDGDALRGRIACTIEQTINTLVPHDTSTANGATGPSGLFAGNFDYHSAVHAHWALLSLYRIAGDAAGLSRTLARTSEGNVAAEWGFLQQSSNAAFERPYGRAWLVLMLSELATSPGRNGSTQLARREQAERQTLEWLENNTAAASHNATIGAHGSWLFALLLLVMSNPVLAGANGRITALMNGTVRTHRATWRTRASLASDFLNVPAIIDTLDLLRGLPHAGAALPASRVATVASGHAVGEEMTRMWPIAIRARTDPAMCRELRTRLGEWRLRPELWEFGPTLPRAAWQSRFLDNSHWTPQFLWMAMKLRCP